MKIDEIQPVLEAEGFKGVEAAGPFALFERSQHDKPYAQVVLYLGPDGVGIFFRVDATGMMPQRIYHFIRSGELLDLQTVAEMIRIGLPASAPPPYLPNPSDMPLRFRKFGSIDRPAPHLLRYGVYFPNSDLCVNDMGGRGTGKPGPLYVAEWIDKG